MVVAGSLQLSHDLGLYRNQGYKKRIKNETGRGNLHLLHAAPRSSVLFRQQDPWRNHLSGSPYRPIHSVFYRSGSIRCHFSPLPGQACQCVKAASMAITKSFNVLQGSPLVLQLLPAIGVIVFAVWGLGPLVRYSRNMLLHKSDSNWKRSRTHYVMTSYIQPLLLWSGAILLCRTLDPVVLPTEAIQAVKLRSLNFIRSLSTVLAFAYCLSRYRVIYRLSTPANKNIGKRIENKSCSVYILNGL